VLPLGIPADSPYFASVVGRKAPRHKPHTPATTGKIPFIEEDFNLEVNHRQLTLSYRLLPPKRRNAAENAAR
jgi:hypothetical protein